MASFKNTSLLLLKTILSENPDPKPLALKYLASENSISLLLPLYLADFEYTEISSLKYFTSPSAETFFEDVS